MYFDEFKNKYDLEYYNMMYSQNWNIGGTVGTCWGTNGVNPEEPVEMFDEFENVLDKINPNIPYDEKCDILKKIASTEYDHESDWYGGKRYYAYYKVTLIDLFDELQDRKLIPEEKIKE